MRLSWVFLRKHKERVKILSKRRQDHLGLLGGDGADEEENEVEKENGGGKQDEGVEILKAKMGRSLLPSWSIW